MAYDKVKAYFEENKLGDRVKNLEESSATVEEAANALGCEPGHIAKTLSFLIDENPILVVTAGDTKVDNKKYKAKFQQKARMIPWDQVESYVGHEPGGVCPFAIKPEVKVYLDISMKRFETVYPAAGSGHSAVELSLPELEQYSNALEWVDVCKV